MKKVTLLSCVVAVCALLGLSGPARADNADVARGKLTACGCTYFPSTADWICQASIEFDGPAPHFSPSATTTVGVEIVEQALGQCASLQASLPRKVSALFWMEAAGPDYVHGILRSPLRVYYFVDEGAP